MVNESYPKNADSFSLTTSGALMAAQKWHQHCRYWKLGGINSSERNRQSESVIGLETYVGVLDGHIF